MTQRKWMRRKEFAKYAGDVGERTVAKWLKMGMPSAKIGGGTRLIHVDQADAWFETIGRHKAGENCFSSKLPSASSTAPSNLSPSRACVLCTSLASARSFRRRMNQRSSHRPANQIIRLAPLRKIGPRNQAEVSQKRSVTNRTT